MDATTKFFLLCAYPDLALDDRWITVKPNGPDAKGRPALIGEGGEIKAGMGGKFNGQKINEIPRTFENSKYEKQKKTSIVSSSSPKIEALKKRVDSGGFDPSASYELRKEFEQEFKDKPLDELKNRLEQINKDVLNEAKKQGKDTKKIEQSPSASRMEFSNLRHDIMPRSHIEEYRELSDAIERKEAVQKYMADKKTVESFFDIPKSIEAHRAELSNPSRTAESMQSARTALRKELSSNFPAKPIPQDNFASDFSKSSTGAGFAYRKIGRAAAHFDRSIGASESGNVDGIIEMQPQYKERLESGISKLYSGQKFDENKMSDRLELDTMKTLVHENFHATVAARKRPYMRKEPGVRGIEEGLTEYLSATLGGEILKNSTKYKHDLDLPITSYTKQINALINFFEKVDKNKAMENFLPELSKMYFTATNNEQMRGGFAQIAYRSGMKENDVIKAVNKMYAEARI